MDVHDVDSKVVVPVRALLVEDDFFTARGATAILREFGIDVVAHAKSLDEVVAIDLEAARADIILVDLDLGGENSGIDVIEYVRRTAPSCPIAVLTNHTEPSSAFLARALDIRPPEAFLAKADDTEGLVDAIRRVVAGEGRDVPIHTTEMARPISRIKFSSGKTAFYQNLTPDEREFIQAFSRSDLDQPREAFCRERGYSGYQYRMLAGSVWDKIGRWLAEVGDLEMRKRFVGPVERVVLWTWLRDNNYHRV